MGKGLAKEKSHNGINTAQEYRGTITVFLSLSLFIILSLIFAVIASARDKAMRMRCEIAMDASLLSVFGEYNRELLKEFDLLFIDSSYGGTNGSSYYTCEHFKDYMSYNLNPAKGQMLPLSRDLFGLSLDSAGVTMESLATDSGMRVYLRQAVEYIKTKYGISIIEDITKVQKDYKQYGIEEYDPEEKRLENEKKLKKAKNARDEDGNKIEYDNPADEINKERSKMLKTLFAGEELSDKRININELASGRKLAMGDGIIAASGDLDSAVTGLLFNCYLSDKFSSYVKKSTRKGFSYEQEYIIAGKAEDVSNLKSVANTLLILREAANCMYIFQDETIGKQAEGAGEIIAALVLCPELKDVFSVAILFAWAYAEACVDVRTLLDGGRIPLMKNAANWNLKTLPQALAFKSRLKSGIRVRDGIDYNGYLQLFLLTVPLEKRLIRSIDMIENDLRKTRGNDHFKMDSCIDFLEIQASVKSTYGNTYSIKRYYGYTAMPKMSFDL